MPRNLYSWDSSGYNYPIVSSISREAIKAVPDSQRELMSNTLGNGKNCYFSLCKITITKCSDAGLGRAAGETMLVTLISGNAIGPAAIPTSLFSQSQSNLSQSSLIANEFNEASSDLR
ncbi:MAG: hypothetical protein FIO03_03265, partial [Nitrosopumilales archaeon]|nr:hypothetical protein [Nitrosopumilales archaeon]